MESASHPQVLINLIGEQNEQGSSKRHRKDHRRKTQEAAGKVIDSDKQQIKGLNKQIEGNAEKVYGDVKQAFKDAVKGR